ncbi:hypothetical protein [Paenibacillus sinopodophylli]|uniref:hypothetical protein n=1 Tax=Paenibacillus sinopodophylli TaxID=1837342 RepID=UPI001486B99D|nr:hypothetical protein [Paenibacillus sinopodophylli]
MSDANSNVQDSRQKVFQRGEVTTDVQDSRGEWDGDMGDNGDTSNVVIGNDIGDGE